jgi:hypothetical protein
MSRRLERRRIWSTEAPRPPSLCARTRQWRPRRSALSASRGPACTRRCPDGRWEAALWGGRRWGRRCGWRGGSGGWEGRRWVGGSGWVGGAALGGREATQMGGANGWASWEPRTWRPALDWEGLARVTEIGWGKFWDLGARRTKARDGAAPNEKVVFVLAPGLIVLPTL